MNANLDSFEVFPWNRNFETGIKIIDEQHKVLVDLLNSLANTLTKDDTVELLQVFEELADYAKYHFETEETEWKPYFGDDPWLKAHREAHACFMPDVTKVMREKGDSNLRELIRDTVKFLIRWLAHHIIDDDRRMAIVLHEMDSGVPLDEAKSKADKQMSNSDQVLIDTVLIMYDQISSRTLSLMRERVERKKIERKLGQAMHEMEQLAITDQLTGLHNRRHFDEVFEQELRRARREKRMLIFIMLDVDHFKLLNDRYGHLDGDAALQKVAHKLSELCRRPGDFIFRLGGEEFGILLTEQSSRNGDLFAERIRVELEGLGIPNLDSRVADHVTISAGLVAKIPDASDTMNSYMRAADDRLYRAKTSGRNKIVAD